ncbi:hypothetical protein [Streptomyces sp. XD-27]|uniref:hypothetical protein n=1 Tax=Streptomyces sp. XD-27 TaxID=3062779 RepID=UPI0026F40BC7|nr:hypothetical protein [Streptomyces sp. XD-27]WKX73592.1 hypothetical protein Q3Y56_30185 [Streptomyces sp. XD-27]
MRDVDADSLAVGCIESVGRLDGPPSPVLVQPIRGGQCWQAVPGALRQALPDEVDRARAGAES